ncbi:hypothetical protein M3612_25200 [Niallia taxi]|uniref:hypothetical protein n=1 Tax=Niallia taxi TaxID=2499688 RepID=UPI00204267F1|nr:hypothetical protein [Niallia taxi]MCM3217771.1 hypothetical protein [Niallia taxi]
MTLIIGVVLPKGILLTGDTRETTTTGEVVSDLTRKILSITPSIDLACSNSESNWYTARILRDSIFKALQEYPERYSTDDLRKIILNLYHNVNEIYQGNHPKNYPVGGLILSEYDRTHSKFNLLFNPGGNGYHNFIIQDNILDIAVIGGDGIVQDDVVSSMKFELEHKDFDVNHPDAHLKVARIFKNYLKKINYNGIGRNVYSSYFGNVDNQIGRIQYLLLEHEQEPRVFKKNEDYRYFNL